MILYIVSISMYIILITYIPLWCLLFSSIMKTSQNCTKAFEQMRGQYVKIIESAINVQESVPTDVKRTLRCSASAVGALQKPHGETADGNPQRLRSFEQHVNQWLDTTGNKHCENLAFEAVKRHKHTNQGTKPKCLLFLNTDETT